MKRTSTILLLIAAVLFSACGGGDDSGSGGGGGSTGTLPVKTPNHTQAFPGADGGARSVTGGSEGSVYIVTNLNDDGEGSLRKAVRNSKCTVVFAVAGQIDLKSALEITASNITIAGQTAPGDGITIANCPVVIKGSNVIMRYLRFRMGDQGRSYFTINGENVTPEPDALGAKDVENILIDHCSISWSIDECASFSRVKNFTMQYCIISESLKSSWHPKGNHGYGGIWGGQNASYHHNLLADHDSRNPRFDHHYVGGRFHGPIDYINNVVYNWGSNSTYGGEADIEDNVFHINMMGNYYKAGPSSSNKTRLMQLTSHCTNCVGGTGNAYPARLYLSDNLINGVNATWDNIHMDGDAETRDKSALKASAQLTSRYTTGLTLVSFVESASNAYNSVLNCAGASLVRDAIDKRIIDQVKNNTGALINSPTDVGGYPTLAAGTPITDTDKDGMPDSWETAQMKALGVTGKAVSEFKPNAYNITGKYTNLEVYLNELVVNTFPSGANAGSIR